MRFERTGGARAGRVVRCGGRRVDGKVDTGYFGVTAIEELQVGVGPGAKVYRLDAVNGRAVAAPDLVPFDPPPVPYEYCE